MSTGTCRATPRLCTFSAQTHANRGHPRPPDPRGDLPQPGGSAVRDPRLPPAARGAPPGRTETAPSAFGRPPVLDRSREYDFRGGDGNVGIIRSPVHAIALPDRLRLAESAERAPPTASSRDARRSPAFGMPDLPRRPTPREPPVGHSASASNPSPERNPKLSSCPT